MENKYSIKVNAKPENIEKIANFVEKNLKNIKIHKDALEEILISIDEAISNVIQHSYTGSQNGYIRLILTITKKKVEVSIFDKGSIFEPNKIPSPNFSKNLNDRSLGGLGVFLMKKFMDEVTFTFKNKVDKKENELKMIKYLK